MSYREEAEMEEPTTNTRTRGYYPPAASSSSSHGRNRQQQQQQQQQRQASGASASSSSSPQPLSYPRNSGSDEDGNTANSYTATSEAHLINSRETYASTSYIPPVNNQEQQPQYAAYNHERSYSQQRRRASPRHAQPTPSPRSPESYNRPDYFNNNNNSSSHDNQLPITRTNMEYGSPMSDINDTPGFSFTEDKISSAQAHSYGAAGLDKNGMMDKEISRSHTGGGIVQPRTGHAGNDNAGVSSIIKGYGTPHQIAYLCVVLLQTISTAALVSVVWAKIRDGTPGACKTTVLVYHAQCSRLLFSVGYNGFSSFFSGNNDETAIKRRTVTVYLAIFLFGSVFEIITAIDALRLNNTIQLIGVCMFTVAMMVSCFFWSFLLLVTLARLRFEGRQGRNDTRDPGIASCTFNVPSYADGLLPWLSILYSIYYDLLSGISLSTFVPFPMPFVAIPRSTPPS
jgi:hypothetical protein